MRRRWQPSVIGGRVTSAGLPAPGGDYQIQKTGTGAYTVTLPTNFRVTSVTVSLIAGFGAGVTPNWTFGAAPNIILVSVATSAGAPSDQAFSFVAVGS